MVDSSCVAEASGTYEYLACSPCGCITFGSVRTWCKAAQQVLMLTCILYAITAFKALHPSSVLSCAGPPMLAVPGLDLNLGGTLLQCISVIFIMLPNLELQEHYNESQLFGKAGKLAMQQLVLTRVALPLLEGARDALRGLTSVTGDTDVVDYITLAENILLTLLQ